MEESQSSFYSLLFRQKYIRRWSLMRNNIPESLSEHTAEVAVIAHALALLTNKHHGGAVDPARCVLLAVYHDVPEILTGDMPTPVKYYNPDIRTAYRQVEQAACDRLLGQLPEDLRGEFRPLLQEDGTEEERRIVKAADKLSALIKCIEELNQGNREFAVARRSTEEAVRQMGLPAADEVLEKYLPAYELPLDEQ